MWSTAEDELGPIHEDDLEWREVVGRREEASSNIALSIWEGKTDEGWEGGVGDVGKLHCLLTVQALRLHVLD